MAVSEQTPYIEYVANGVSKNYPLGFDCDKKEHLIVTVDGLEPNVSDWSLLSGSVVFNVAPLNNLKIIIQRNTPFQRNTDFQTYNNSFRPQPVNQDFDNIWKKLQEMGVLNWLVNNNVKDLEEYVVSLNDETKSKFLEMIQQQGVSLGQLDQYINNIYYRLANIAVNKGWVAELVADKSGRSQQDLNTINHNIKMYGAIGDGILHTVNEWTIIGSKIYYPNLAAIQVDYPHVTSLTDSIDWAAAQKLVNILPLNTANTGIISPKGGINGGRVLIPRGRYVFNKKLQLNRGIQLCGESRESSQIYLKTENGGVQYSDAGRDVPDEITIRDIAIIQDPTVTATSDAGISIIDGVATTQATSFTLENILIVGTYYGIQASAGIACAFTNVITTATVKEGIYIPFGTGFTQSTSIAFFNTYTYLSQTGSGVKIEGTAYGAMIACASDSNAKYAYELSNTIGFKLHGGAEGNGLGGVMLKQCRGTEVFVNIVDNAAYNSDAVILDQSSGTIIGGVHSSGASATGMSIKSINSGTSQTIELSLIRTGGWNNASKRSSAEHTISFNGLNGFCGGNSKQWSFGISSPSTLHQLYNSGDASSTVQHGFVTDVAFNNSSAFNSAMVARAQTQNSNVIYSTLLGMYSQAPIKGAASTITRYIGHVIDESSVGTASNANLSIGTLFPPSGNWNIYSVSTRPSYFAGPMTYKPLSSATPSNNGDLTFELTSDTTLKIKVKGSDGVVRMASLTLS